MTPEELSAFRLRLEAALAEIETLEAENARARATVELDQQSVGRLARTDAMERQAMALATQRRRIVERRKIAAALTRIDDGEFGFCADCGEEIARGRLDLDPTVLKCVSCAV